VFDSAVLSTWIRAAGLPELDWVAFGIGQPGEASVWVDLRVQFDGDASFAKLGDHPGVRRLLDESPAAGQSARCIARPLPNRVSTVPVVRKPHAT
jgi:hypothetical protein